MTRTELSGSSRAPRLVISVLFVLAVVASASAAQEAIDTDRSTITVHVFKSGLFRAFGDNHEIQAPIAAGSVAEPNPHAELVVAAVRMRVLDPGLSASDRAEVQRRMLGPDVLDVERFPQIRYESTGATRSASGSWVLQGQLTLHGQTRSVMVSVTGQLGHFRGSASVKQTDFGIRPITIAAGTVKVKDEVRIEFEVFTRSP